MDLRHLRYLVAIAEEGSFSKAAVRLRIAQQALSKQIADLEAELGAKLFDRSSRGVKLNSVGLEFLDEARSILAMADRARAKARSYGPSGKATLRIGLAQMLRYYVSPIAVALLEFRKHHQDVRLEIIQMSPAAQLDALHSGSLDIAMVHSPPDNSGAINGVVVGQQSIDRVMLPAAHSAAKRGNKLWLRDLRDLPFITFSREANPVLYDHFLTSLTQRGLFPTLSPFAITGHPSLLVPIVSAGLGWAVSHAAGQAELPLPNSVVTRSFSDEPIFFGLWLLSRRDCYRPEAHDFVSLCQSAFRSADDAARSVIQKV